MIEVTFRSTSVPDLRAQMQTFLTLTVPRLPAEAAASARDPFPDTGFDGLLAMDEPLPRAVKRRGKLRADEPTPEAIEAAKAVWRGGVTHDDVRDALRSYLDKYGEEKALEFGPRLVGAPFVSQLPDDPSILHKARTNLLIAVSSGRPQGL